MTISTQKIAVIGAGHVGAHVASQLITKEICQTLVMIDKDEAKARSQCRDLADSAAFSTRRMTIVNGEYSDLDDADIVVVCASGPVLTEDRLDELDSSQRVIEDIAEKLQQTLFNGLVIVITNPCDVIAQRLDELTPYQVIGTGTLLDSARLRVTLARETGLSPQSIQAYCLGEHGNSQVIARSAITFMGQPLAEFAAQHPQRWSAVDFAALEEDVVNAGWNIVLGKGSTEFGIGATTATLIQAIYQDAQCIMPCSTRLKGQYGIDDVFVSVPCIIGKNGVESIVELSLAPAEQARLVESSEVIRRLLIPNNVKEGLK